MLNQYYTYILSNKNDTTLYIGVTNDIERRVVEHRSGTIPGFTQKYKCHKLVYFESFSDVEQAIAWHRRASFTHFVIATALPCHPEPPPVIPSVVEESLRSLHSLCSVEMTFTSLSFWFDEVFYINLRTV